MYMLNSLIMIIPTLTGLFMHSYFCHGKLTIIKKTGLFFLYGIMVSFIMYGAAWTRGIKGDGIAYMTLSHKIEFTILGCVMSFCMALGVCLCIERDVTLEKFKMYLIRFAGDVWKYYKYAIRSARADLRSEVANAYLDWLWWLIEPFCMMLIYTLIFGVVFHASEEYFPVFIFSGLSMWTFFSRGMNVSVNIVRSNKGIISKVYLPKFILYFARMLVNGFKMLVSFAVVAGMLIVFRVPVTWRILYLIPVMIVFFLFTFGLGTILMHFGVHRWNYFKYAHVFYRNVLCGREAHTRAVWRTVGAVQSSGILYSSHEKRRAVQHKSADRSAGYVGTGIRCTFSYRGIYDIP